MDSNVDSTHRRLLRAASCLLPCIFIDASYAAPNVLNLNTHGDTFIGAAINAVVGPGVVDHSIFVDYDTNSPISDLTQPSTTTFSVASGARVSHVPYGVANYSLCCSKGASDDFSYYQILTDANATLTNAPAIKVGGPLPDRTPPPTYSSNASSPNSANGGTGWGIEFGLATGYLGLDTTEDSWNSATLAGFFAALKFRHPTWTWFDVKAALRQTASNWPTGYSHLQYGYGLINWNAANAIASPSALYLQPPGMFISADPTTATIQLFPFRQTRRVREVAYAVDPSYTWPAGKNELTAADIAAAGGVLLFTSNGTDLIATFTISRPGSFPMSIAAFTTDDAGHYSRVEEFSVQKLSDLGIADIPIPAWAPLGLAGLLLILSLRQRRIA